MPTAISTGGLVIWSPTAAGECARRGSPRRGMSPAAWDVTVSWPHGNHQGRSMPAFYRLARRQLRPLVGVVAAVGALAGPTAANAACPASQAFAAFGDTNSYTLAQNGSLENGSSAWRLNGGARVVDNADPFGLLSAYTRMKTA